jgi:hypothetical protein
LNWHRERPDGGLLRKIKEISGLTELNFQLNDYYLLFRKTGKTFNNRKKNIHTKEAYKHTLQREGNFNHDTT